MLLPSTAASASSCSRRGLGSSPRAVVGGAWGWVALAGQCAPGQCEAFPWDCCAWGCFQHSHSRDVSLSPKELSLDRRLNTCSAAREDRAGGREHLQTLMFPTPTGPGARLCSSFLGPGLGSGSGSLCPHCLHLQPFECSAYSPWCGSNTRLPAHPISSQPVLSPCSCSLPVSCPASFQRSLPFFSLLPLLMPLIG